MGNSLGGKKIAKVMKINGETLKLKTPIKAGEIVKDYPGHVLMESEAVKHFGIRARPLEPNQELLAKRLYFLVELPKSPIFGIDQNVTRRVRSGINMSAKDRLESLMLARRSTSDLSIIRPSSATSIIASESEADIGTSSSSNNGTMRVRMRLPKAEVEKLMQESKDGAEAAAKIVDLCMANAGNGNSGPSRDDGHRSGSASPSGLQRQVLWKSGHSGGGRVGQGFKAREKRVSFMPVSEAEMQIAVASY